MSVILLIIAGEAPSVLTRLPLPEERLSDRLQLRQLETDFFQVEGPAVLDLPHGERVHVDKSDVQQLPGEKDKRCRRITEYFSVCSYYRRSIDPNLSL